VATLCALFAAGLSVQTLLGAGLDRGPRIRAMRPKADAYVSAANRTQNFGRSRELKVDFSPTMRAYVLFDVDLRSLDVQQVSLLLYSRTRSRAGYQVRLVVDPWRERRITFANAPVLSADFVASGPLQARAWKAVDVTSFVSGDERSISFALTTVSPKGVEFASRETGLHGPRLVVESQDNRTTGSTTTSTDAPRTP
jgi:hypothetical protein